MVIHVVQGERERVSDCRSLARFELRGIPPMTAGAARIRVSFDIDADGLLSVGAREQTTGVEATIAVKPSYGLRDDEIARMLQESFAHAADDMLARALAETQVEADRIIAATESALQVDGDLLSSEERSRIDRGDRRGEGHAQWHRSSGVAHERGSFEPHDRRIRGSAHGSKRARRARGASASTR
jgi:molecular chaperone HscA